ncbi:transposable element Tcb1 transposase [Trichonephila clavipes]|nr:transposable element Tcb1 transposase [Trichonephila clavipes]
MPRRISVCIAARGNKLAYDQLCLDEKSDQLLIRVRQTKDSGVQRLCGLSLREIGSRVGRNQTTVMRISDRWMQEGTTDRRGRSHPPQCTTSLSARTIRRHLQQSGMSARRPLLGLHLTQNNRRLRLQ